MKKLIIIPLLLIGTFCFSQTIDTLLGVKGKIKKDTSLTIDGNYLFTPSRNHLSFDSSKLIWFLNGSKAYTKIQQVGIGSITPRAKFMISDSTGAVTNNDSTGILLTNDTTTASPSLTFSDKGLNGGVWVKSGFRVYSISTGGASTLHIQHAPSTGVYTDVMTLGASGVATFANSVNGQGLSGSTFSTSVTTTTFNGTNINLGNNSGGWGIAQTTTYGSASPFTGGGLKLVPSISSTGLSQSYTGVYFNPTLTNYPNLDLIGFQNEAGRNLLNSTSDNTGVGVTTIDHSAKFQVGGTSQGVLFPVMTQSQRDSMARPVTGVTITSGGSGYTSTTTGQVTFSVGAIRAKGQFTASGGVVTSVSITEPGAYGAGQTPVTVTFSPQNSATGTVVLGASAPATGLTVFCSNCTANDSSTGVYQTWNGSTWKNWW